MADAYGTWPSPIAAAVVAAQGLRLGYPSLDGDEVYWLEGRPQEGGRNVLVRRAADGGVADVTPPGTNVRTRVHEYGGGAYLVADGTAYFANFADQRVYRLGGGDAAPEPLTPEGQWFYADFEIDRQRNRLVCVREDHSAGGEPVNTIVSVSVAGGGIAVLAEGYDFYSSPRLSPDGSRLCWICWRHPNMPWDGTELWVADVADDGSLHSERRVAGGANESIFQPGWSPDGALIYVSDRTGYWQIYQSNDPNGSNASNDLCLSADPVAEYGRPQWLFGWACWAFVDASRIVVTSTKQGRWQMELLSVPAKAGSYTEAGSHTPLLPGHEPGEWLAARDGRVVAVVGSATEAQSVVLILLPPEASPPAPLVLRSASTAAIDPRYVSLPEAIEFPSRDGGTAHAFYYPPTNGDVESGRLKSTPTGSSELPPLIVISHGGPTTATKATLDLGIQFWTSRGFAVADVNYGGSSGYGRPYRERLNGQWGVVDVTDCIDAALFLAATDRADRRRLAIRGGSAGGYTTLASLTFYPEVFGAGASYYGISDIEVLARDTHKFESRYLDTLVGPYPARQDLYRARSPIYFVDRLACPLILLQGLEDKVVPPNQAQMMADAVRAKGLPVALIMFEGEQHGFRRAETIIRSLEAELYFYGVVFGFTPADPLPPIAIDNV